MQLALWSASEERGDVRALGALQNGVLQPGRLVVGASPCVAIFCEVIRETAL